MTILESSLNSSEVVVGGDDFEVSVYVGWDSREVGAFGFWWLVVDLTDFLLGNLLALWCCCMTWRRLLASRWRANGTVAPVT
jgi:hypothetical protein